MLYSSSQDESGPTLWSHPQCPVGRGHCRTLPFSRRSTRAHRTKFAGWRGAWGRGVGGAEFIINCTLDSFSHPLQLLSPTHIQVSGLHLRGSGEAPGRLGQPLCKAYNCKHPASASQTGLQTAVIQIRAEPGQGMSEEKLVSAELSPAVPKPRALIVTLHLECSLSLPHPSDFFKNIYCVEIPSTTSLPDLLRPQLPWDFSDISWARQPIL